MSESHQEEKKSGWRWGVNRWILLAIFIAGIILTGMYPPARPAIFLEAEALWGSAEHPLFIIPLINAPFYITNTLVATVLADIIVLMLGFLVLRPAVRKGASHVAGGLAGALEGLLEVIWGLTESTAGKYARKIFPWFAAITLMVLIMNWMELFPGVDSIGIFSEHHAHEIEHFEEICHVEHGPLLGATLIWPDKSHGEEGVAECAHAIIPYVRAVATDLNFTVALALVSVVMIQVVGVSALGLSYFEKFIYVRTLFSKPFFGLIDFAVGLFEIVSELSKVISFSFRLFGNIFAGAVLLFVLGTLIPVGAQAGVLALEFAVGLIQAIVFGMLTMIFMAQATHSHHGGEEEHH